MQKKHKKKKKNGRFLLVSLFSSSLILSPFFLLTANNKTYQNFSEKNIIKQQNPEIINFNFHENDILVGFNKKVHNLHLNKIFDNQKSEIITKVSDAFSIKTEVKKKTKIKPGFLKPGPIQWNYKSDPKKPGYNYIYERIVNPGKYWNRITGNPAQIVQNVRIGYWNLANFTQQTNFNSIAKTILDTKSSIMALSENFGGGSNLDSSKILENLNLDSKNSETEWVQVSSKNGKNQENETKKYSFFYKKNELTLSGNHISKPDSNPFLVSDQQINNTFPVALGFKALNNNKEFLVIMGDFAQKIQEKAQEPEEQTDQNRKNSKENDSETNKERIYHPFLFSDEEKPVIKQEQNSKPTKKLSEIIEEFKKKSGISEVIFLTSTNQDRKIGTGLGKENYDALINSSNSVTNALITDTKNLVKKIKNIQKKVTYL